jgi:hypothetical protein
MMASSSTPLADYFWIAGVESISYNDPTQPNVPNPPVESTIAEDGEPEEAFSNGGQARMPARHSRQNSANRLSKISLTDRFSIHTLDENDGGTMSNRSSATIRPVNPQQANGLMGLPPSESGGLMGDFDFDKALVKFAAERENFLEDLSFSAGAKLQARPPMVNPRAERIRAEESDSGRLSPLRSIKGSIRRKMSFRDMNSMRKQPSIRASANSRAGLFPPSPPRLICFEVYVA